MCKQRQQKTKTLVQEIAGMKMIPGLLTDEDKVAIMEWLLQRNKKELGKIYNDPDTPAFVAKCIDLLTKRPITAYIDLMQSFKSENDNEGAPAHQQVGFATEKKAG